MQVRAPKPVQVVNHIVARLGFEMPTLPQARYRLVIHSTIGHVNKGLSPVPEPDRYLYIVIASLVLRQGRNRA